jgi:hypothetical protein
MNNTYFNNKRGFIEDRNRKLQEAEAADGFGIFHPLAVAALSTVTRNPLYKPSLNLSAYVLVSCERKRECSESTFNNRNGEQHRVRSVA